MTTRTRYPDIKDKEEDFFGLYQCQIGNINYVGVERDTFVHCENEILNEPTFSLHHSMVSGVNKTENELKKIQEMRELVADALRNLTGDNKVTIKGGCVGYPNGKNSTFVPNHFRLSFVHQGKVVSLEGVVSDVDEVNHSPRELRDGFREEFNSRKNMQ